MIRYFLPRDIPNLFDSPSGPANKITDLHERNICTTFCNIVEKREVNGTTRYKIRISKINGDIKEGWTPGSGLDPVVYDPEGDLLDGRFNL